MKNILKKLIPLTTGLVVGRVVINKLIELNRFKKEYILLTKDLINPYGKDDNTRNNHQN